MAFELVSADGASLDARHDESLIARAAEQGPAAMIWQAEQGLVVPRTYRRFKAFDTAAQNFADLGWPVTVRLSGGGIVPQGPGIVNISLAYAVHGKPLDHSDDAYRLLCRVISETAARFGAACRPQEVHGSFCDGRYNLAVDTGGRPRKIAGTAQLWRRHALKNGAGLRQVVLVHGLILAEVDAAALTDMANRFEAALGSDKRYDSARAAALIDHCRPPRHRHSGFIVSLMETLAQKTTAIHHE